MPKLTSNAVFFGLNVLALIAFFAPIFHGPWAAQVDLHHMRKTFPGIEVAVKAKHFNDCLNENKDESNEVTAKQVTKCRDDHYEKTGDDVSSLVLNTFTDGAFSLFQPGKKNDEQIYWASVWHYYTTFYEYTVKYTGYRRYEKDLCDPTNSDECKSEEIIPQTTKSLTKEEALEKESESGYVRNDQLGFFLQTYGKDLSMSDIMAFGGHGSKIIFLHTNNEYMVTTLQTLFYQVDISAAALGAKVTNKEAGYILNNRTNDQNKAYMSAWEADVYGVPQRKEIVFDSADGKTRKKATFTTLANETSQHVFAKTCTQCYTKLNPATPFMPVDNTGGLQKGDDAVALSPATCKEAASDIMYTNIINTLWHVVLLLSVYFGFLYNKTDSDDYKEAIQLPLFALFLNAGLVNIVNVSTVWKCQFVKNWLQWYLTTSVFLCFFGVIFYFGVFILPMIKKALKSCGGKKGYQRGELNEQNAVPNATLPVNADLGFAQTPQSAGNYMFRVA